MITKAKKGKGKKEKEKGKGNKGKGKEKRRGKGIFLFLLFLFLIFWTHCVTFTVKPNSSPEKQLEGVLSDLSRRFLVKFVSMLLI